MPFVHFSAVRASVPLVDYLESIGWHGRSAGRGTLRGWCPIHSLTAHRSRIFEIRDNRWRCHKCYLRGDVIDLHAAILRLTLHVAATQLAHMWHIDEALEPYRLPQKQGQRRGTVIRGESN